MFPEFNILLGSPEGEVLQRYSMACGFICGRKKYQQHVKARCLKLEEPVLLASSQMKVSVAVSSGLGRRRSTGGGVPRGLEEPSCNIQA
jgi:hypothetical protein